MPKGVYVHKLPPPSRKGVTLSEEHKQKIREAVQGNTWNRGRTHTKESSELKSKNSAKYWLGKKRGPQSEETRKKRSESLKGIPRPYVRERMLTNHPTRGKFGKEHPGWKEVKKRPLYKSIRALYLYKEWRTTIFTRDNFSCVNGCGRGYIEADHFPKRFVDVLREENVTNLDEAIGCKRLWDTENGRTLCKPCHLKTLSWGKKSTKQ